MLTLGARTPNFTEADVLIDGDRIAEVGTGLRARDAEQVDATDTIVMPGFVDTHRHAWTSLFRNLGDGAADVGQHYGSDDVYAATLIGLLGAIEAGITTVVDWSDNPQHADAALRAHTDSGLRTVFVHVARRADARGTAIRGVLSRLAEEAGPSTSIALGSDAFGRTEMDRLADDWALARELGMRIHVHAASATGAISEVAARGLLGEDVTVVHCSGLDEADLDGVAGSGAAVSLTPFTEMAGGLGTPPIQQLIDRNVRPGLGVDDERVAAADMFAQMRATISLQHATAFDLKLAGKAGVPRMMTTRDVIRSATVEGARVAGLGAVTGSLQPGMQADVIVLRTDRPNIFPVNDPIGAVVWGMDTSNVDAVIAGGRVVLRGGALGADVGSARELVTTARDRVMTAAGLVAGAAPGARG